MSLLAAGCAGTTWTMIPWSCDALDKRYASDKFRRATPYVHADLMGYDEMTEMCAFLRTFPLRWSQHIFAWSDGTARWVHDYVLPHYKDDPLVAARARENDAALDVDTGLAALAVLQQNGWESRNKKLPPPTRMAMLELRAQGWTMARLARELGLSYDQVNNCFHPRRKHAAVPLSEMGLVAQG